MVDWSHLQYNLSMLNESDTVVGLVDYANVQTGNFLAYALIISVFFILLMSMMRRHEFIEALVTSCFVCFVLSALLSYAHFVPFLFVILFMAGLGVGGFLLFIKRD